MDEARIGAGGRTYSAEAYEALGGAERQRLRPELVCPECEADAYFVRHAINGRPAYFGARPHGVDCSLATTGGEAVAGRLHHADATDAVDGGLILRPMNADAPRHVTEDADGEVGHRQGHRHGGRPVPGLTRRGMNLNRLLRRLIQSPEFATGAAALTLPDGTHTTVREWCVLTTTGDTTFLDRQRIFWGTIRYAHTYAGGVWLNLGRGDQPTIRLRSDLLASVMASAHINDVADLQGAAFAYYGHLRRSRNNDRLYFFPDDPEWFTIRLASQDSPS
ncbi:hypothetical protein [Clavibacter nebraskensis]|uniref:hypothetical protein n=1 Tax=Clavibacter nebraskensis TaxID=31963 RepID=UPI003F4B77BB